MNNQFCNNESYENRVHSSLLVPFSLYHNIIPDYFAIAPLHKHKEFEINIIYEGIGIFTCEETQIQAYKGDIVIMPCNKLHSVTAFEDYRLVFDTFIFNPDMLGAFLQDRATQEVIRPFILGEYDIFHIPSTASFYKETERALLRIIDEFQKNNAISDVIIKSELLNFITAICIKPSVSLTQEKKIKYFEAIKPCVEYINENYMHDITIEDLAKISNLSKSFFMVTFKNVMGYSAIDYTVQVRIKNACDYLLTTDMNIADIAYACGYNNLSNFNRQFKSLIRMSPKDYRTFRTGQE